MTTLLPIYQFARVLGINPLHIMGVWYDNGSARSIVCGQPIMQYSWQAADGVSRHELSLAIEEAEAQIANELGYWPAATWTVDERVETDYNYGGHRGWAARMPVYKTSKGLLISGGRKSKTLLSADAPVAYSDNDGDGYKETAIITANVGSLADPEEVALYYPGLSGDDGAEIRPIKVVIAAGVATITCRREQLVVSQLYERVDATAVDGALDGNFLSTADVYRRYHDPNVQAQLVWRGDQCSCSGGSSCSTCGLSIQNACTTVVDSKLGLIAVSPAEWDQPTSSFVATSPQVCGRQPDYVRLWYRSGYRDKLSPSPNTTMSHKWQLAVAKLAISKLDREICGCQAVADVQGHWNADLRKSKATRGESTSYKLTTREMDSNPFGTTVAAVEVWRLVRKESLGL